ncbi:hypothetical protein M0R04_08800 [Candidatus Dojkabacteria bacterium]|jgi:hypothetical protein|nr:hypothetical protein [Candidatus Dojkabacteria bacterium]
MDDWLVFLIGLGITIGMIFMILIYLDPIDNGLMKIEDCKPAEVIQPKIICNNYTIKGDYYYCFIDDIEQVKP